MEGVDGSPRSTTRSNRHGRRRSNVLCRNKEQRCKQTRHSPHLLDPDFHPRLAPTSVRSVVSVAGRHFTIGLGN